MDADFCYIHRPARALADLQILACENDAELRRQVRGVAADYPTARLEVFHTERRVRVIGRFDPTQA